MGYEIFDEFRVFFLLFMGMIHINQAVDVTIGKLNHHYFGWVEDAQGFVFISGFVVGLVYGTRYLKYGRVRMVSGILRRMRTIYLHQAGLILIILAAALSYGYLQQDAPAVLRAYEQQPFVFAIFQLLLVAASTHMGILPMYLYFMAATPAVLWCFRNGHAPSVVAALISVWLFAQTGLLDIATQALEERLEISSLSVSLGIFFNVFGWQLIYFSGLYFGFRLARNDIDISFLRQKEWLSVFFILLGSVFLLGIYDRVIFDFWVSREFSASFLERTSRQDFGAFYVLAFAADLFLVTWLLVAGRACGIRLIERASAFVDWLFRRPFLVFLGQHSLHVFSFHILVVYAAEIYVHEATVGLLGRNLILIAGALSLYLPAWLHARSLKSRLPVAATAAPLTEEKSQ